MEASSLAPAVLPGDCCGGGLPGGGGAKADGGRCGGRRRGSRSGGGDIASRTRGVSAVVTGYGPKGGGLATPYHISDGRLAFAMRAVARGLGEAPAGISGTTAGGFKRSEKTSNSSGGGGGGEIS